MTQKSDSFLAVFRADRQLDPELRRRLVASLFASPGSLAAGAIAGVATGLTVVATTDDFPSVCAGIAVPVLALLRIVHGMLAQRQRRSGAPTRTNELLYEIGAWLYSALLGILAFLVLTRTNSGSLHLLLTCVAIGYAAGICARNATRPIVALAQLTLAALPVSIALAFSSELPRLVLAAINLLFIFAHAGIVRRTYFAFQSSISSARALEDQLKDALDHLPQMAWCADKHGTFTHYNRRWTEFTGATLLDSGGSPAAYVHPEDWPDFLTMWNHCLESGSTFEAQYRLRHRSGRYRWVLALGAPERDAQGRPVRWHGTITDIHDKSLSQRSAAGGARAA